MDLWEKFVESAVCDFRFLETDFAFKLKQIKQPFITYESDKLKIDIFYDVNRNRELDLGVRKIGDNSAKPLSIGIGMLMQLRCGETSEGYRSPFPSTEESLKTEVRRLSELLRKCGTDILKGDMSDFERIDQLEKKLAKKCGPKE